MLIATPKIIITDINIIIAKMAVKFIYFMICSHENLEIIAEGSLWYALF